MKGGKGVMLIERLVDNVCLTHKVEIVFYGRRFHLHHRLTLPNTLTITWKQFLQIWLLKKNYLLVPEDFG